MFGICNDFYGRRNRESALSCLSIAPPIEIIANLLQIPNIEITFTKYTVVSQRFLIFCYNDRLLKYI